MIKYFTLQQNYLMHKSNPTSMKKLYSLFVAVLVCAVNFAAFADSFTFKVNMPDKVTVRVNGDNVELTGESTVITCDQYAGVNVELADGYLIKSFVNQAGTPQNNYGNYTYFSPENGDCI